MFKKAWVMLGLSMASLIVLLLVRGALQDNIDAIELSPEQEAFELEYARANAGDALAQYNIGVAFYEGGIVGKNLETAVEWFELASAQDMPEAQYNLALFHLYGQGIPKDETKGLELMTKSGSNGYVRAQVFLGDLYRTGASGVVQNYEVALSWYQEASEQGDLDAGFYIGYMMEHGMGEEPLPELAAIWYQMGADNDHLSSLLSLGNLYAAGKGVPENDALAFETWGRAAELGMPEAQLNLALAYKNGSGVTQNNAMALLWMGIASAAEFEPANAEIAALAAEVGDAEYERLRGEVAALLKDAETQQEEG